MDECDNILNIDPADTTILKRKLDRSSEELSFPCKKIAMSPPSKSNGLDVSMTHTIPSVPQIKLTKAECEALKMEKSKERDRNVRKKGNRKNKNVRKRDRNGRKRD